MPDFKVGHFCKKDSQMEIITIKKHVSEKDVRNDDDIYHGSPDAEFMKMSHKVDENPPETWKKYDVNTDQGMKKIIEMEYQELMNAKNKDDKITNIYHLSVALLRYWRINKDE